MSKDLAELTRPPHENPILERIETSLPPGDAAEQIDAIIRQDDAQEIFKSLDPPVFYRLMKRAGWDQSYDLVQYATPRQIQTFLDFDVWQRDQILPEKMDKWFGALASEADDDHFKRVCRELDPEMLAIYFKANLEVEHTDEEQRPPEHLQDQNAEVTPDGQYAVVYPDDEDRAGIIRLLIDRLFHVDRLLVWTLLEAVRWELISTMQEEAYQWRNSRLEEYGFVSRDEAMEIYAFLDPVDYRERVEADETADFADLELPDTLDLPAVFREEFDEEFYIFEIVRSLVDDEDVKEILFQMRALLNRAMVADGIEPGEVETGREVVRRTLGYLSLGLAFLARGDRDRAQSYVRDLPVKRIFRAGYSLTAKLQKKLRDLQERPTLTLMERDELSLLNPDDRALAESLLRQRPTYASDRNNYAIFKEQDQLDRAAVDVGMIAFKQLWLFGFHEASVAELGELVFSDDTRNSPDQVTFDLLFATRLVNEETDAGAPLLPIDAERLERVPDAVRDLPSGEEAAEHFGDLVDEIVDSSPVATRKLAVRWIRETVDRLHDELDEVQSIDEPKWVESIFLLAAD